MAPDLAQAPKAVMKIDALRSRNPILWQAFQLRRARWIALADRITGNDSDAEDAVSEAALSALCPFGRAAKSESGGVRRLCMVNQAVG